MPPVTQPVADSRQVPSHGRTMATSPAAYAAVMLHYLERSPILVQGPVTGRPYEFSGSRPDQSVDVRDAEALLRTRFFRKT
ncbi:MAG: hypothetical protein F9K48_06855 [Candidatus Brocadia sp.]|nr:MAG: hypothetical protein F9K48_06855 [Candidatus Brocadia sp.]